MEQIKSTKTSLKKKKILRYYDFISAMVYDQQSNDVRKYIMKRFGTILAFLYAVIKWYRNILKNYTILNFLILYKKN